MVTNRTLDPKKDTLQETHEVSMKWVKADAGLFDYSHSRPLPQRTAQKAIDYIATITKQYPFQIRFAMAQPLWERFAQEWCDTGDEKKALRVI